ncbi:MAG: ABC transporter ATP-binding protein [Thermoleophilia bacterium]
MAEPLPSPTDRERGSLDIRGLRVAFNRRGSRIVAVNDVDLGVSSGQTLGLVGESGSGKTMTLRSVIRLLPRAAVVESGEVIFDGVDVLRLPREELRKIRARSIGTVFQDPYSSLNPVSRVGAQLTEALRLNLGLTQKEAALRAVEALRHVGIPQAEKRVRSYPHELSGGMRQRVMFAIATAARPRLLLADEPTTALDVTTQAQILALLARLRAETGMTTVLVSHDFGVIAQACDTVAVMYAGHIVERAPIREVYRRPHHPYTQGLLNSIPSVVPPSRTEDSRLSTIPGQPPELSALPAGCPFQPRCPHVRPACTEVRMKLERVEGDHFTACPFVRSWDVS